jgi:oxygen-dependent protoporphyrinogen oxidase
LKLTSIGTAQVNVQEKSPRLGRHVVIVGGGLSGLSTAFFLSRRAAQERFPLKVTVLEASDRFGGVLRTLTHGDLFVEAGADAFSSTPNDAIDLCRELGLQEDLVEAAPCFRRFFGLKDKKFFSVLDPRGAFFSAVCFLSDLRWSFFMKLRMLGEPFIPRRKKEGDESLASFIRRRLGECFYQEVAKPLAQGVYMMDPEQLSLAALFPRLQQAEKAYGSLAGYFLNKIMKREEKGPAGFLTLKNGLEGLVRALLQALEGCELRRPAPVRDCAYNAGWEIFLEDGEVLRADTLVLAMNACDSSKLLSRSAPELSRALSAIPYDSIASVNLIYKSEDAPVWDLEPGFLVPMDGERCPFSSLKWIGKTADGKNLMLRAFLSKTMMPEVFNESDETLEQKMRIFLRDSLGVRTEPLLIDVKRYPSAFPQYETGHLERIKRVEEIASQYPGLFLAGNGFRGFGITDCIRQARITASRIQSPVGSKTIPSCPS